MIGATGTTSSAAHTSAPAEAEVSAALEPPRYEVDAGTWQARVIGGAVGALGGAFLGYKSTPVLGWATGGQFGPTGIVVTMGVAALAGVAFGAFVGDAGHKMRFQSGPLTTYYRATGISTIDAAASIVQAHDRDGNGRLNPNTEDTYAHAEKMPMQGVPGVDVTESDPELRSDSRMHLWRTADSRGNHDGAATATELADVLSDFDSDRDGRLQMPEYVDVIEQYW